MHIYYYILGCDISLLPGNQKNKIRIKWSSISCKYKLMSQWLEEGCTLQNIDINMTNTE